MAGPTVAIMQPYFFPYGGYYRLLAAADIFVIFDCVQFPRRGWVHRNQLHNAAGELDWLTLPLAKADYHARIDEMNFTADAEREMAQRMNGFPALSANKDHPLVQNARRCRGNLVDYLERQLKLTLEHLQLPAPQIMRSSSLTAPADLHATERILWLAKKLNAKTYINAPGGREIYTPTDFAAQNIELKFLTPYDGPKQSMLERILTEPAENLRKEITSQCELKN